MEECTTVSTKTIKRAVLECTSGLMVAHTLVIGQKANKIMSAFTFYLTGVSEKAFGKTRAEKVIGSNLPKTKPNSIKESWLKHRER